MSVYNRSQDLFLGVPFNIASYALFQSIIAKVTGYETGYLYFEMGDTHLYEEHRQCAITQISRFPFVFPKLELPALASIEDAVNLTFEQVKLVGYTSHPAIKAKMIA